MNDQEKLNLKIVERLQSIEDCQKEITHKLEEWELGMRTFQNLNWLQGVTWRTLVGIGVIIGVATAVWGTIITIKSFLISRI